MLRAYSIAGNRQRLDGGAMFGNAPRPVWSRWLPPDAEGRIELACRALLVETADQRILFETGIGAFFEPELRRRYGVLEDQHVLLDELARRGLSHEDIDVVVLSHLHFDHAGGVLSAHVAGQDATLLFPQATYVVSQAAYERALRPHPRDRASFIPGLAEKLEASGRLTRVHEGDAGTLLGSQFAFHASEGHTPGLLLTRIAGRQVTLCFCSDLAPGVPWVHLPITMGYDRSPEQLVDEKRALFSDLAATGAWLFFTHDPTTAAARLVERSGRFAVEDLRATVDGWDLDEGTT